MSLNFGKGRFKKEKGLLFEQLINGVWRFIGFSTKLKPGYKARIYNKKLTDETNRLF